MSQIQISVRFEHVTKVCKWGFQGGGHALDAAFNLDIKPSRVDYVRHLDGKATIGEVLTITFVCEEANSWLGYQLAQGIDKYLNVGIAMITTIDEAGQENFSIFNTRTLL
jgi:hypothetical protein